MAELSSNTSACFLSSSTLIPARLLKTKKIYSVASSIVLQEHKTSILLHVEINIDSFIKEESFNSFKHMCLSLSFG